MEKVNCQQTGKLPSNNHLMPQMIYKPKFVEPKQSYWETHKTCNNKMQIKASIRIASYCEKTLGQNSKFLFAADGQFKVK